MPVVNEAETAQAVLGEFNTMAKRPRTPRRKILVSISSTTKEAAKSNKPRWQIESPTRGVYVGSRYAERPRNWPLFERFPSEDRIIRFDDREAAEAELVYVHGYAANARLREVD